MVPDTASKTDGALTGMAFNSSVFRQLSCLSLWNVKQRGRCPALLMPGFEITFRMNFKYSAFRHHRASHHALLAQW